MHALMDRARVPGLALATVRNGRVARVESYGFADVARSVPVKRSTIFETASISKIVIGVCIMQLVEQGKVTLDEDISKLLPFAVRNPGFQNLPITLRMLLSHVASVQDDPVEMRACTTRGDPTVPLGDFLRRCMTAPDAGAHFLGVAPAKVHRYSNLGASLAAMVVEVKSGESFDVYSRAHVLEPLGITGARWKLADLDTVRIAIPHRWTGRAYEATGHVGHTIYPVVDLRATAEDVATLLGAFTEGGALGAARILRRETLADMLRPHYPALDANQGLVFQRIELDGRTLWGHEGEDEGATTMAFFDPEARDGAVLLANGDAFTSNSPARAAAMKALLREALR